jgi:nitroreductase
MGFLGVAIPEEFGGAGAGHLELCVIAEEIGRALAPVPFSSTVYLAAEALMLAGSDAQKQKWLPKIAAGEAIGTAFRAKYPDAAPEQLEYERKRLARAPLVIAVVSRAAPHVKIPEWEQVLSAGAAAMSLVFAAHALGFAANWITEWYAYDRTVLDALGLAPHEKIAGFIHIGRHATRPDDRPRPPLSEIVTRFGR